MNGCLRADNRAKNVALEDCTRAGISRLELNILGDGHDLRGIGHWGRRGENAKGKEEEGCDGGKGELHFDGWFGLLESW